MDYKLFFKSHKSEVIPVLSYCCCFSHSCREVNSVHLNSISSSSQWRWLTARYVEKFFSNLFLRPFCECLSFLRLILIGCCRPIRRSAGAIEIFITYFENRCPFGKFSFEKMENASVCVCLIFALFIEVSNGRWWSRFVLKQFVFFLTQTSIELLERNETKRRKARSSDSSSILDLFSSFTLIWTFHR